MKRTVVPIAALSLAALLGVAGCGSSSQSSSHGSSTATGGRAPSVAGIAATGSPLRIGYINTESGPLANTDLTAGVTAAVKYINGSLGGVHGHPIVIDECQTQSTPETSAACGAQLATAGVVAVVGGSDQAADSSIPPLAQAKIPYFATQPTTTLTYTSPDIFDFTGGAVAAYSAEAQYIVNVLKAKTVDIIYPNLPAGLEVAQSLAQAALTTGGVKSELIPAGYAGGDLSTQVALAERDHPAALWAIETPASCTSVMKAVQELSLTIPVLYDGACMSTAVTTPAGAGANGAYFNSEYHPWADLSNPDVAVYHQAMQRSTSNAVFDSASEAGFSEVMNLYTVLKKASTSLPKPDQIIATLNTGDTFPGFLSHSFSCTHKQVAGYGAICNNNELMLQWSNGRFALTSASWINAASLLK